MDRKKGPPESDPNPATSPDQKTESPIRVTHPADAERDLWAWTAVHLNDGRVISLAWLRGYRGAVVCEVRRG
jgi:hypothetical protein